LIELHTLGTVDLVFPSDDPHAAAVRSRPKALGLLVYLALESRIGPVRRDRILPLLWPELSEARARRALSQTLYTLRRALESDAILGSGQEDLRVDAARLRCDACDFLAALEGRRPEEALGLYRGDFMTAFHVPGCLDFDLWRSRLRNELRRAAVNAALALADSAESPGDSLKVAGRVRWALSRAPNDEGVLQEALAILDRSGNRAAALEAYEAFAQRLRAELELEPSPETEELVSEIRGRTRGGFGTSFGSGTPSGAGVERDESVAYEGPTDSPRDEESLRSTESGAAGPSAAGLVITGAAAIVVAAAAYLTVRAMADPGADPPGNLEGAVPEARRVAILRPKNDTGDPSFDWLAGSTAEWIADGVSRAGVAPVVPVVGIPSLGTGDTSAPSTGTWPEEASFAVTGSYLRAADSIQFRLRIVDAEGLVARSVDPVSASADDPMDGLNAVAAKAVRAVAAVVEPGHEVTWSLAGRHAPTADAHEAYLEGLENLWSTQWSKAVEDFHRATELDPGYIAPLNGLSTVFVSTNQWATADSVCHVFGSRSGEASRLERLWNQHDCALVEGDRWRALRATQQWARRQNVAYYFLGRSAAALNRPEQAVRAYASFDPTLGRLNRVYAPYNYLRWAEALHHLGRHERELQVVREGKARFPTRHDSFLGHEVTALIGLGRFSEAERLIDERLSRVGPSQSPVALMDGTASEFDAHGSPGSARRLWEALLAEYESRRGPDTNGMLRQSKAWMMWRLGRTDEAASIAESLVREFPRVAGTHHLFGVVRATQGRRAEALAISDALADWDWPYDHGERAFRRAEILAALGDLDEAVALLDQAMQRGWPFPDPHSILMKPLRGHPAFEEFIKPKG
jgi:DNA-binding SARP family transcriptional activator